MAAASINLFIGEIDGYVSSDYSKVLGERTNESGRNLWSYGAVMRWIGNERVRVSPVIAKAASRALTRCSLLLLFASTFCALSSFVPIDAAVKDMQHAVSMLGDVWLMRHQNYGVSLAVKLIEETHYLLGSLGVEVSGRFVSQ
jgi:hypothetical protein